MGKINYPRVGVGGLLAGLVINTVEGASSSIFMEDWTAAMEALGLTADMSGGAVAFHLLLGFLYGLFAVWVYAAIRPRFGPGPRTAIWAGLAAWFGGYFLTSLGYASLGIFPSQLLVIGTAIGLVEMILATLVGALVYKEA